jgi:hypothetical protein
MSRPISLLWIALAHRHESRLRLGANHRVPNHYHRHAANRSHERAPDSLVERKGLTLRLLAHYRCSSYNLVTEVDPKGWTKFGRRLDGAAG